MRESKEVGCVPILPCRLYEELLEYGELTLEEVLDELESIKEENVFIVDDDFLVSRERVSAFL